MALIVAAVTSWLLFLTFINRLVTAPCIECVGRPSRARRWFVHISLTLLFSLSVFVVPHKAARSAIVLTRTRISVPVEPDLTATTEVIPTEASITSLKVIVEKLFPV